MRTIGLTGGIGSGKSTVAQFLSDRGAQIIDADAISRQLTGPDGAAMASIRDHFGHGVMAADGALDRAAMRQLMMTDPRVKRQLEAILHPMIAVDIGRRRQQALEQHCPVLILDIPLLAESAERWRPQLDAVWVGDCEEDVQVERVIKRSGWSAEQVRAVIALQATRRQRLAIADAVIHNSGAGLDELLRAVDALWSCLQ